MRTRSLGEDFIGRVHIFVFFFCDPIIYIESHPKTILHCKLILCGRFVSITLHWLEFRTGVIKSQGLDQGCRNAESKRK